MRVNADHDRSRGGFNVEILARRMSMRDVHRGVCRVRRRVLLGMPLLLAGCSTALPDGPLAAIRRIGVVAAFADVAELQGYSDLLAPKRRLDIRALWLDDIAYDVVTQVMRARDPGIEVTRILDFPGNFYETGAGLLQWSTFRSHARQVDWNDRFDAVVAIRKGLGAPPGGGSLATGLGATRSGSLGAALFGNSLMLGCFAHLSLGAIYGPKLSSFNLVTSPWGRRALTQAELDRHGIGLRVDDEELNSAEAREGLRRELSLLIRVATQAGLAQLGFRIPQPNRPQDVQEFS